MAFKRALCVATPEPESLTAAMAGIGMNFASASANEPNIEDTLFFASVEGVDKEDFRVLAILVTWFGVHHTWVNADRLTKLVIKNGSPRVRAFWCGLAQWQKQDHRFARLAALHKGRIDPLSSGTDFQIRRRGEDPRFEGTCIRIPANLLRDRGADVLSPEELALRHRAYRYRVAVGPNYRADLLATLEAEPRLSASDLARRTCASFASAWQAKRDFVIAFGENGQRVFGRRQKKENKA